MDENQAVRSAAGDRNGERVPDQTAEPAWSQGLRGGWASSAAALRRLTPAQRLWGGLTAALLALTLGGLLWYAARPDWRVLYTGLDAQDAREIASALSAASLPFDLSADGATIRVPADSLDKARLATTAKGGPKSGRMGFELFDKPNWIGSEFDEKVNYQRALEGELEHTIASMEAVESARVHVTLPHESLFTDEQRAAKASVVLKLRHRTLNDEEADAVRNLVASAVDGLSPDKVMLADADGHAMLGQRSGSAEIEAHEQALAEKLIETLEPVAGTGNVRASVNVDYDSSTSDETDETYDPTSVITLAMQKSQQTATPAVPPAGVPGTASNTPSVQPPLFPSKTATVESSTQENGSYAASKKTRRVQQGGGKIHRITAAILVNDRMAAAAVKSRPASWKPRDAEEMKRLSLLAQAAIGYDAARGDQISVENISFEENTGAVAPGMVDRLLKGASQSEALLKYATLLAAMLGLILFVIRPIAARSRPAVAAKALPPGAPGTPASREPAIAAGLEDELVLEAQKKRAQTLHDGVIENINSDPVLSSRLLQSWIHAE